MSVFCAADPLVWSAGKYFLIRLVYPLTRVVLGGGGAGREVFTEAVSGALTVRARN